MTAVFDMIVESVSCRNFWNLLKISEKLKKNIVNFILHINTYARKQCRWLAFLLARDQQDVKFTSRIVDVSRMAVEMSCLKVENEECQTVGVIPIYCGESTLANIRKEIEDDFEINNFWFMWNGSTLETSEEVCTSVASIARDMVGHFTGKRFFSIAISNNLKLGTTADSMNENEPLKTTGFDSATTVASGMMPIPKTSKTEEITRALQHQKQQAAFYDPQRHGRREVSKFTHKMMFRKQRAWKRKEESFGTRKSSDSAEKQINRKTT